MTGQSEHTGDDALALEAVELAADWLEAARDGMRRAERSQAARLARMIQDPAGKEFAFALADRVFRPPTAKRAAACFRALVDEFGIPDFLSPLDRLEMEAGALVSGIAPGMVMPLVTEKLRRESASVILPGEGAALRTHLALRRREGIRMNLNQLGEAVLGENEAENRLQAMLARLASPDCDCLSVKISAIFSQIHLIARTETIEKLKVRLRQLFRAAMAHTPPKFIYLDMEEYGDLSLTCEVFTTALDEPEFVKLEAGIALQAYLPEAWPVQKHLTAWAKRRVSRGGTGIKIRLVKGANLAMEKVDAELNGWPQAPYSTKEEVDANYKRMLHEGCRPENAEFVRIGVASHNLFDLAYALLLRTREGVADRVEFEMLEGMANHQARVLNAAAGGLLLYAPVVNREDFHSAIAYLVRRLDENTAPENFLHDLFGMKPGDVAWNSQRQRFLRACAMKNKVSSSPRRTQNRATERYELLPANAPFRNEPDTDWALPHNAAWIREKVEALREAPMPGVEAADEADIEGILQTAEDAREAWQALGFAGRSALLRQAAAGFANRRGELIATMVRDADKAVAEADAEVSEAIDYANYYARSFSDAAFFDGAEFEPLGTVAVVSPWNFPLAIPCGGVLAALMAGNTVILKPATATAITGRALADCLWDAGIPREVLQFVSCTGETGRTLLTDDRVNGVILTGGWRTARMFLSCKPGMRLFAETSGKNALVITAAADAEQAVKDLVKSAFGHSGQKCSAASLAIVEAELYDSPAFRRQLRDAAASLTVGPPWDYDSMVTPLVTEPGKALQRGLTHLDPGEEWLLEPRMIGGNPRLWSPGIRLGVKPDGWFRRTECFGPVLGVIRADSLRHAIRIQNDSSFGLTGGIHSLDPAEIAAWREAVEVGNAYINRPITGAIVRRQSFGGWKDSCFGPGAKAGGPNYGAMFGTWKNAGLPRASAAVSEPVAALLEMLCAALPADAERLQAAAASDAAAWRNEFGREHDPSGLACESNVFRYRPFARCLVRAGTETTDAELARLLLTAACAGVKLEVSVNDARPFLAAIGMTAIVERGPEFAKRRLVESTGWIGLRAPRISAALKSAAIVAGVRLVDHPVLWNARLESLWLLREQSVSETRHRYGNLLPEARA